MVWLGFMTSEESRTPNWDGWLAELAKDKRTAKLSTPMHTLWITAERMPQFRAIWPDALIEPAIEAPDSSAEREWSREEALVEIVRGRLEGLGPVTQEALSASLGVSAGEMAGALAALQSEGFALCGRFTPGIVVDEWCERRLLARIHHYTVKRCALRSSRWRRAISCASCWPGSTPVPIRAWKGRTQSRQWSDSSKASRRLPPPGRPRSCRRGLRPISRPGWTITADRDASPGHGCVRARTAPTADRRRCGQRRSRCSPAVTRRSGHLSQAARKQHSRPATRRPCSIISGNMAPRFSTSCSTRGCCGPRSRKGWPSWWPWVS